MNKHTITDLGCQELSGASSEIEEKSNYRRADIRLSLRTQIALDLLSQEGEYGVVTPLATVPLRLTDVSLPPERNRSGGFGTGTRLWTTRAAPPVIDHPGGYEPMRARNRHVSHGGMLFD